MELISPDKFKSKSAYSMETDLITTDAKMPDGYPKVVKCNPYTVGHMKKLVYAKDNTSYLGIMAGVIQECVDTDVLELTIPDLSKLILYLRVNSMSGEQGRYSSYQMPCKTCGRSPIVQVDFTEFDINLIPSSFLVERKISEEITAQLPRVKTIIDQNEFVRSNKLNDLDEQVRLIKEGDTFEEKKLLHDSASPEVIVKLSKFGDEIKNFGIINMFNFVCPEIVDKEAGTRCGGKAIIRIPFRHDFFLPDLV